MCVCVHVSVRVCAVAIRFAGSFRSLVAHCVQWQWRKPPNGVKNAAFITLHAWRSEVVEKRAANPLRKADCSEIVMEQHAGHPLPFISCPSGLHLTFYRLRSVRPVTGLGMGTTFHPTSTKLSPFPLKHIPYRIDASHRRLAASLSRSETIGGEGGWRGREQNTSARKQYI